MESTDSWLIDEPPVARTGQLVVRPTRGWIGLMMHGLGPQPSGFVPKRRNFPNARRFRVTPVLLAIAVYISAIAAMSFVPHWLGITLLAGATNAATGAAGVDAPLLGSRLVNILVTLIVLAVMVGLFRTGPKGVYSFFFGAAMDEEVWFRYGSESWTWWQRVRSVLQFSVAHLSNLIVAVVTLGVLALIGGVFMVVYLVEVRRTGDPRRALVTTAHFHATYNVAVISILALHLSLIWLLVFLGV